MIVIPLKFVLNRRSWILLSWFWIWAQFRQRVVIILCKLPSRVPLFSTKKGHGWVINHRKPQHPCKTQRNQQSNIHTNKFQWGDTVVWAPIRSQSKTEEAGKANQKSGSNLIGPYNTMIKGKKCQCTRNILTPYKTEPFSSTIIE